MPARAQSSLHPLRPGRAAGSNNPRVAQSGRALALGARGRRIEAFHVDHDYHAAEAQAVVRSICNREVCGPFLF